MRRPLRSAAARALADLAIDLGDPGRMARARKLHRAAAVAELEVEPGQVSATVVDAPDEPCDTAVSLSLPLRSGEDVPTAAAISETACTCDDPASACTHTLATILSLAEEVESDPSLLVRWTETDEGASPTTLDLSQRQLEFLGVETSGEQPLEPQPLDRMHFDRLESAIGALLEIDSVDAWSVFIDAIETMSGDRN